MVINNLKASSIGALSDIYTRCLRASAYSYIKQSTSACVTSDIIYHLGHTNKNCPNLKTNVQLLYVVWVVGFDCEF